MASSWKNAWDQLTVGQVTQSRVLATLILTLLLWRLINQLKIEDFWFDEAGQYFMALGQHHFSSFGGNSLPFSLQTVADYNLDPPGFSLLLRWWIELVPTESWTLRLLPALAILLTVGLSIAAGSRIFHLPIATASVIPVATLLLSPMKDLLTELRAYSLEFLAVIWLAFLIASREKFSERPRRSLLILLPVSIVVLSLSTRYSLILAVVSSALVVTVVDFLTERKLTLLAVLAWLAVTLGAFLNFAFINLGRSLRDSVPSYVAPLLLSETRTLNDFLALLGKNFLLGPQFSVAVLLVAGALWAGFHYREIYANRVDTAGKRHVALWEPLLATYLFVLFYTAGAVLLSTLGLYPWDASTRWSVGYVGLAIFSSYAFASFLINRNDFSVTVEKPHMNRGLRTASSNPLIQNVHGVAVILISAVLFSSVTWVDGRAPNVVSSKSTIESLVLESGQLIENDSTWLIDPWFWASFRLASELSPPLMERLEAVDLVMGSQVSATDLGFVRDVGRTLLCSDSESWVGVLNSRASDIPRTIGLIDSYAKEQGCSVNIFEKVDLATWVVVSK